MKSASKCSAVLSSSAMLMLVSANAFAVSGCESDPDGEDAVEFGNLLEAWTVTGGVPMAAQPILPRMADVSIDCEVRQAS